MVDHHHQQQQQPQQQQQQIEANKILFTLLLNQTDFLDFYFSPNNLSANSVASSSETFNFSLLSRGDSAWNKLTCSTPLLDYLYDKCLQLDVDMKCLLYDVQFDLNCTVKQLMDRLEAVIADNPYIGTLSDAKLRNFRTLYRFRYDNQLHSHADHYQTAFVPFYRFSRYKNFSQAVGNTMKKNIRLLYDHIYKILNNRDVCPCIILYNLFVRDTFRLFSLVSTQHYNYVRVYDDLTDTVRIVTYVELTNSYPQASQWFPNINNQYVKKYGGMYTWQKLQYNVQLMLSVDSPSMSINSSDATKIAERHSDKKLDTSNQSIRRAKVKRRSAHGPDRRRKKRFERLTPRVVTDDHQQYTMDDASTTLKGKKVAKSFNSMVTTATPPPTTTTMTTMTTTTTPATITTKRLRFDHLFQSSYSANKIDGGHLLLDRLFRSNYLDCKHPNVVRVYVQLRSGDESATLIVRCTICGKRL